MTSPTAPHRYQASLVWQGTGHAALLAPPRPSLEGDASTEFGGSDGVWDPEHLLLASANLCLMLTFRALAAKARLEVASYEGHATATVEKAAAGYAITSIAERVALRVRQAADIERAKALLQTAKRYCIVSNVLKIEPTLETDVTAA